MNVPKYLCSALLVFLIAPLSGCGENSDDDVTVAPAADAFIVAVQAIAANSPDDTEPSSIDSLVATLPDDTEPVSL